MHADVLSENLLAGAQHRLGWQKSRQVVLRNDHSVAAWLSVSHFAYDILTRFIAL